MRQFPVSELTCKLVITPILITSKKLKKLNKTFPYIHQKIEVSGQNDISEIGGRGEHRELQLTEIGASRARVTVKR